jgi:uncharacterized protein (DUF169 family)
MSGLSYQDMQRTLMDELRLYHLPIAVKYLFDDNEIADFTQNADYVTPLKNLTFCQWEIAARMKGQTVLATPDTLGCTNAAYVLGWRAFSDAEVLSHLKYVKDEAQAERFLLTKPRLEEGRLKAIVVAPLGETYFAPNTVHFYCDNMQAYHLAVDYMAATDVHPLPARIMMNSAACAGNVYSFLNKSANLILACSGSYNAGKTERGEINFIVPGVHIEATVARLLERKAQCGSSSVTRPGDNFPGADICKNCSVIVFKKAKRQRKTSL